MKLVPDLDNPFNSETTEGTQLITRDGNLVTKWNRFNTLIAFDFYDSHGKTTAVTNLDGTFYIFGDSPNDLFHTKEEAVDYSEWVGKWCKFWDEDANVFCCDIFVAYCLETSDGLKDTTPYESQNDWFKNCELLPDDLQNRLNEVCK